MANRTRQETSAALRASCGCTGLVCVLVMACVLCLVPPRSGADEREDEDRGQQGKFCSATAHAVFRACGHEVQDTYWRAVASCINISDHAQRAHCFTDAKAARREGMDLCHTQRTERHAVCQALGEDRYDPAFDPALFDTDFRHLTHPNPYFPLRIGNRREYRSGTETITVEVLHQTKLVAGVRCIVVRDLVKDDGHLIEATDDWFAQAKDGTVWYCGEEVKNYETFEGDDPIRPELVNIEGSFKAGRDGDKPGIIFPASPTVGEVYREEFSLSNAEDVAEVLSTTYAYGHDPEGLDRFVPQELAELLCGAGDCVVTKNYTPLEPGLVERKYYARGIGFFLEVKPETGEVVQLVRCNFDPRCARLPQP